MTTPRPQSAGFSLGELLTAVAVVAILLALLFPALRHAREEANTARCLQQLRALGVRVLATASDHNGALPWYERANSTRGLWWYKTFIPTQFEGFTDTMRCASQKATYQMFYKYKGETLWSSYRYNKFMGYQDLSGKWVYPLRRLQALNSPHLVPMLADFAYAGTNQTSDDAIGFETWAPLFKAHRAETVATFLCVDGHAERLPKDQEHAFQINPANLR